ncbi:MAG: hypothetical protein ACON4O_05125 [Lentimonas sp.]
MEVLKELLLSGNIVVWIIAIVALVILLKFLKSAGKLILIASVLGVAVGFLLETFAPGVLDPLIDFVKSNWLGEDRPNS